MRDLLLLHGALGTSDMFHSLSAALSTEFNIHTFTFSGHGMNSSDNFQLTMDVFCNDIIRYLDDNNLNTVNIFGYSMGGYAAVYTALKNPERISKIMTLATVFDWSPERSLKEAAMLDPEKIQLKVPDFADQLKKLHGSDNWKSLLQKTAEMMKVLGENHLTQHDFSAVTCPVRVAVGDRDKMVSIDSSHAVSKSIPQGSFLVLPETPHPFEYVELSRLVDEIVRYMK